MRYLKLDRRTLLILLLAGLWLAPRGDLPAETDGNMRQNLEKLDFSERMITGGIYAKSRHDVFQKERRKYVHGVQRTNLPFIYEPDVYTWELAMAAHNQALFNEPQLMGAIPGLIAPVPMDGPAMYPGDPGQVQLTPLGPQTYLPTQALPGNADEIMQRLQYRASGAGLAPSAPLRADTIKQRLLQHMNSLGQAQPLVPVLPQGYPRGRAGDSCDSSFDPSY